MTQPLTLKYRPAYFNEVVGQNITAVSLARMVSNDDIPNGLLFSGPRGTGKTSVARILAMELNPDQRENILAGDTLSVVEIDAASNGRVDDVRQLTQALRFSAGSKYRVVILDEAHSMTREAFNALLKTLEEPPPGVIFVLVTTEPHKLPPTVLSRLMEFEFRRVAPADLFERIRRIAELESVEVQDELLVKIAERADGSVRDAINSLDQVRRAGITTADEYIELVGEKDVGPTLLAALMTNNHAIIFRVLDKLMLDIGDPRVLYDALNTSIRDLFVLKSGGSVTAAGKALEDRIKLAQLVKSNALFAAVRILWELKTKVRQSENPRVSLEQALILVAEKLSEGKVFGGATSENGHAPAPSPVTSEAPSAPRALSLSEIQQM